MSVRPRAKKLPTACNLTAFLESKDDQTLRAALDFEINFGRQSSRNGWRIELSTLPWLAGLRIYCTASNRLILIEAGSSAHDFGKDVRGASGPDEGLRITVVLRDVFVDRVHEFRDIMKDTARQLLFGYALERNELVLYYQPQIDLANGRVAGVARFVAAGRLPRGRNRRKHRNEKSEIVPDDSRPVAGNRRLRYRLFLAGQSEAFSGDATESGQGVRAGCRAERRRWRSCWPSSAWHTA